MTKQEHINKEILSISQFLISLLLWPFAVSTTLLLSILDYFVTPENFTRFLFYRIIASSLLLGEYFILKLGKNNKIVQTTIVLAGALTSSIMVELMVLSFGGHQSPYYAGMIIVLVFVLGFVPISLKTTAFISFLVFCIYLIPILLFDNITNVRIFINNIIFLLSFAFGGLAWRYYNNMVLNKNLSLEYDLMIEKQNLQKLSEELEKYSHHLEELVAERTKDLTVANKRYAALFDNSNDGVAIMNKDGIILDMNKRFCELHGFNKDALIGSHFRILEVKENEKAVEERMNRIIKGEAMIFETQHYRKDGTKIFLEVSSRVVEINGELYIQSLYRDITEKKALQKQLLQSQKMESIGVLSGGLAHDFRNLLTVIQGYSEMIEHLDNDPTINKYAGAINSSTRKAEQMVASLLQFAKQSTGEITTLSINDLLNNVINLVTPIMTKENITIEKNIPDSLPSIKGDSNLLEQVIMNLIINAKDAMPDGGRLTVETTTVNIEDGNTIHPLLNSGEHILIRISDSGIGIPEDIKDRIFEPFFTTKGRKGTGLGLAMAYGIIKAHNGIIKVNSELNKGSTFEVYLPLHGEPKPSVQGAEEREVIIIALLKTHELIAHIKNVLEPRGYRIIHTDNISRSLDILSNLSEGIVTFMVELSLMDGDFLIRLKDARSDIKIIIISDGEVPSWIIEDKSVKMTLMTPFNDSLLLSAVQSVSCLNGVIRYDLPQSLELQ